MFELTTVVSLLETLLPIADRGLRDFLQGLLDLFNFFSAFQGGIGGITP